jgi:hypothetical protein
MTGATRQQWKTIERALAGELDPTDRRALQVRLRGDAALRRAWDTAFEGLRALENDADVSEAELAVVEAWVLDDVPSAVSVPARGWPRLSVLFALAAAALALLWVVPRPSDPGDASWQARGVSAPGRLTLQVLCGPAQAPAEALAGGAEPRCAADDVLGFAYWVRPDAPGRRLTLFGVDADGDAMYYAPTPSDAEAIDVQLGRWTAVDAGVKLSVNHAEGPLRVFGLLAPRAMAVQDVQRLAEDLSRLAPAQPGDPPWPQRLQRPTLDGLCARAGDCDAVELRLWIGERSR